MPFLRPGRGALALALTAAACGRAPAGRPVPTPLPAPTTAASGQGEPQADLERLRALGYLDTAGAPKLGAGKGAVVLDPERTCPGYTLVVFSGTCSCQLLTLAGEVVRSWSEQGPCHLWEHAELMPEGDLLVVGATFDVKQVDDPTRCGRYLERLSWDGRLVWRSEIAAHHDVELTPRGQLLTLVMERRRIPEVDPDAEVVDDRLTLLSPAGVVLESVSLYDVIAGSKLRLPLQVVERSEHGGRHWVDLFHCNAARWARYHEREGRDPIYGRDTVLVTSRHQDVLMIVDWSSRQLLWFWGRGVLSGPHDGSLLPSGNLLVFDNGLVRRWSRVLEVNPLAPREPTQFSPGKGRFFSPVMGSCQRLANGNTLIVHSEGGSAVELGPQGRPVWTYDGTQQTADGHRVKLIRVRRLPPEMVEGIIARRGR